MVACRSHHGRAALDGIGNDVFVDARLRKAAPRAVHNVNAVQSAVHDGLVAVEDAVDVVGHGLERNHAACTGYAGDTDTVVGGSTADTGNAGAMAFAFVERVAISRTVEGRPKVVSAVVVDVAVVIVIHAVVRHFAPVRMEARRKIFMLLQHARIADADQHQRVTAFNIPCVEGTNGRQHRLLRHQRVIRLAGQTSHRHRFGHFDVRTSKHQHPRYALRLATGRVVPYDVTAAQPLVEHQGASRGCGPPHDGGGIQLGLQ